MTDDGRFLARWSRRKRDAIPKSSEQSKPANAASGAAPESTPPGKIRPFDPASLPPIESISAASDIRAFLSAGVPADLTRAALRRAWSSDPMIRDFVGLSENSWDFNAPDGVPGFGSVKAEDLRQLLAQVMGEPKAADDPHPSAAMSSAGQPKLHEGKSASPEEPASKPMAAPGFEQDGVDPDHDRCVDHHDLMQGSKENAAQQREPEVGLPPLSCRIHGGALPRK
jgi:hypothetical protein